MAHITLTFTSWKANILGFRSGLAVIPEDAAPPDAIDAEALT